MPAKQSKPKSIDTIQAPEKLGMLLDRLYSAALLTGKDATYGRYEGALEATRAIGCSVAKTPQGKHLVCIHADA